MLQDNWITREELYQELCYHREVEFSVHGSGFFAAPLTNPPDPLKYGIWKAGKLVFEGTLDQIFAGKLDGKYSLNNNYDEFEIGCLF